jgi:two-component system copper resistance phosphate regulon response regulator CusR
VRVLIIDADEAVVAYLHKGLQENGFIVDTALSATGGERFAFERGYAVILGSFDLCAVSGDNLLRRMRRRGLRTPVLVVTQTESVDDRVAALSSGADDVVVRTCAFEELLARVHALQRRSSAGTAAHVMRMGDLEIDRASCRARRGGEALSLTLQEYTLLCVLLERRGAVVTREFLTDQVWDLDFDGSPKVVDVAISRLRAKLDDPFETRMLHTVRGVGYRLDIDDLPRRV